MSQLGTIDHSPCCLVLSKRPDPHWSLEWYENSDSLPDPPGTFSLFRFSVWAVCISMEPSTVAPHTLTRLCNVTYPCKILYLQIVGISLFQVITKFRPVDLGIRVRETIKEYR